MNLTEARRMCKRLRKAGQPNTTIRHDRAACLAAEPRLHVWAAGYVVDITMPDGTVRTETGHCAAREPRPKLVAVPIRYGYEVRDADGGWPWVHPFDDERGAIDAAYDAGHRNVIVKRIRLR
jgi:hypothetical protein